MQCVRWAFAELGCRGMANRKVMTLFTVRIMNGPGTCHREGGRGALPTGLACEAKWVKVKVSISKQRNK